MLEPPREGPEAPSFRASTAGDPCELDWLREPSSEAAAANRCRLVGGGLDDGSSSNRHWVVDIDR